MSAQPARGYLGISEVLAQLRPDFADISVSKIRFLETEGLITPARSASGYRRFCAADVERLRYILAAQRDQYLPLKVIKDRLTRLDDEGPVASAGPGSPAGSDPAGQRHPAPGPAGQRYAPLGVPAQSGATFGRAEPGRSRPGWPEPGRSQPGRSGPGRQPAGQPEDRLLTRRELQEAAGISEALLTELDTFGLLRRAGRHYGQDALEVARTAVALAAYGVEARHLRAVRAAAERETTMIESLVAPILRQRATGAADLAGRTAAELAGLVLRMHSALVDGAPAEAGLGGTAEPAIGLATAGPADGERPAARGVEGASA